MLARASQLFEDIIATSRRFLTTARTPTPTRVSYGSRRNVPGLFNFNRALFHLLGRRWQGPPLTMAKQENNLAQFKYAAMSNLVLQADRRFVTRRGDENTGDPESLAGRLSIRDMGSRTARDDAPTQKKKPKGPLNLERGNISEGGDVLEREQRKGGSEAKVLGQAAQVEVHSKTYSSKT